MATGTRGQSYQAIGFGPSSGEARELGIELISPQHTEVTHATATGNSSIVLGASAGNIITVNVPQTDLTGVTRGDTGGVNSLTLPYLALPTTAGNNELSIVMT